MAGAVIVWHGEQVKAQTLSRATRNLRRASRFLRNQTVQLLRKGGGGAKGGNKPSLPGESPHAQTGRLAQSIFDRDKRGFRGMVRQVGTNLLYGVALELGWKRSVNIAVKRKQILARKFPASGVMWASVGGKLQLFRKSDRTPPGELPRVSRKGKSQAWLVFGRQVRVRVLMRPYLRPALQMSKLEIARIMGGKA